MRLTNWPLVVVLCTAAAFLIATRWHERRLQRRMRARVVGDRLLGAQPLQASVEMVRNRTVWDYLEGKLFPTKWWPVKDHEQRTFLRTQIDITLSGADRLRLLLTGCMRIYITTYTDVEVKQAESLSNIEVHPFKERFPPLTAKE